MELTRQQQEIKEWLKRRQAIMLAHNYQPAPIQDVADLVGDSLELSLAASKTDAAVIVFCGVHFMAETAAILCPDKTVLLPRLDLGCCLAESVKVDKLIARKEELPGVPVVTYVNSTAAVKAESDICCTSANAVRVVNSLKAPRVLMLPDQNLGLYVARHTQKSVEIITWEGWCNVHDGLSAEDVLQCRAAHPQAVFLAHPSATPRFWIKPTPSSAPAACSNMRTPPRPGSSSSARKPASCTACASKIPASSFTPPPTASSAGP